MTKYRLFIDPASKSCGWAQFKGTVLLRHGTIAVDPVNPVEVRLRQVYEKFVDLSATIGWEEAHIEQLVRTTHIYTHYSVGVIMAALSSAGPYRPVKGDIPISSWQKVTGWKGRPGSLVMSDLDVASEDELAACMMGIYYTTTQI